jgi:hypothetical protein
MLNNEMYSRALSSLKSFFESDGWTVLFADRLPVENTVLVSMKSRTGSRRRIDYNDLGGYLLKDGLKLDQIELLTLEQTDRELYLNLWIRFRD